MCLFFGGIVVGRGLPLLGFPRREPSRGNLCWDDVRLSLLVLGRAPFVTDELFCRDRPRVRDVFPWGEVFLAFNDERRLSLDVEVFGLLRDDDAPVCR